MLGLRISRFPSVLIRGQWSPPLLTTSGSQGVRVVCDDLELSTGFDRKCGPHDKVGTDS